MAVTKIKPQTSVIVHSDKGSQYMSMNYQGLLKWLNLTPSTSKVGSYYDNATMESFYHTLNNETVHRYKRLPRHELKSLIFRSIEGFYNSQRIHSSLGYLSPQQFRMQYQNSLNL